MASAAARIGHLQFRQRKVGAADAEVHRLVSESVDLLDARGRLLGRGGLGKPASNGAPSVIGVVVGPNAC